VLIAGCWLLIVIVIVTVPIDGILSLCVYHQAYCNQSIRHSSGTSSTHKAVREEREMEA